MAEEGYTITRRTAEAIQKMLFEHERRVRGKTPMRRRRRSAAGKGGGVVPVKILRVHPDSPTASNKIHMFQGDVYANGSQEDASKEDVTIRIMGIAPGVDSYPETVRLAAKTTQTWTDKNGTDVKETVYEIEDPANEAYLVKVFGLHGDSPTFGQRMFYGSVYEDGSGSSPTASSQTIRLVGLADDIEEYPSFPISAVRIAQTWTGATQSHTEYVYEATAPLLWGQT